jgi:choline dehydrogenase-like flavoprotein
MTASDYIVVGAGTAGSVTASPTGFHPVRTCRIGDDDEGTLQP